jgi:hypothetical protein
MSRVRFVCAAPRSGAAGLSESVSASVTKSGPGTVAASIAGYGLIPVGPALPLWRLIGANNRELGRLAAPAVEGDTCCDALARLTVGAAAATSRIKLDGGTGSWSWLLELRGVVLAVSGRSYLRQRECMYSLTHFLHAVPLAVVTGEHCRVLEGTAS